MNSIVINNQTFFYADQLEEISLEQWQILSSFQKQKQNNPESLSNYSLQILPKLLKKQHKKLQKTNPQTRLQFLNLWSETIAQQPLKTPKIAPKTIQKYASKIGFHWPKSSYSTDGIRLPLIDLQTQAFCEATDLLLNEPIEEAHTIAALLCHPPNKPYEHPQILQQAQKMKQIPMNITLSLFDELIQTHKILKKQFPSCYQNPLLETSKNAPLSSSQWIDVMLWLADFRPSEIKHTEKLPCYEFMKILNAKRQGQSPLKIR